jgi:serine/threonine protein kinase
MSQDFEQTNLDTPLGGRYKIISELGAGGFGQTFLAEDLHLPGHPRCVVKKLRPQTKDPTTLAMARRLFDTEAQVLYQLGNHNQIPRLLAHFEDNEEFYLVQELIEGKPLTQELVKGQRWTETQVITLVQDVLQVLAFVHQQNVIHRDLKPPNLIRRRDDGKIVLIDFGAVKQVTTQTANPEDIAQTDLTVSIGTKGYMPNEQVAGSPRFSSDVYAVGMLAIQALTGVHPKRIKEDPRTSEIAWREYAPQVSPELANFIDPMVRYDFRDRYSTAVEALNALRNLPPALLDSVPPPQPLSEATGATPTQQPLSPASGEEPTEYETTELPTTDIWVQAGLPPQMRVSASDADATAPLPLPQEQAPNAPARSVPADVKPGLIPRRFVKLWPILAVLAVGGATFAVAKTFQASQRGGQSTNLTSTPTPTPSSTSKPIATPTPSPTEVRPTELLRQADKLRQAGQTEEALLVYDKAIDGKPKLPKLKLAQAYWGRCYCLNKLKKPDQAIVACNDALDLNPDYAEALWSKGNAFDLQNNPLDALDFYEQATRIKPNFTEAWVSRGVTLQGFGRSSEALDAVNKAIDLNRDSAKAWSTKGEALFNLGRMQQSIESFNKALELQPNNPEIEKKLKKAQEELQKD